MKKNIIITIVFVVSSLLAADWVAVSTSNSKDLFKINSNNEISTEIEFSLDGYEMEIVQENGLDFTKISNWNEGEFLQIGKPSLPRFSRLIAIPDEGELSVEILSSEEEVISNIIIYPRQTLETENKPSSFEFVIDEDFYADGELFPGKIAEIGEPAIMRDFRVANITINPFQFDPKTQELKIINNITVKINYSGRGGHNTKITDKPLSRSFDKFYRSTILNYEYYPNRDGEYQAPCYLFIYPANMPNNQYFNNLVNWKHQKGFEVNTASTSETGSSLNSIKNYIQNAYDNWDNPPEYVCLLGDDGGSFDIPTADLSGGEGDQFYTLLEGNDILADVFIGRLSFNSLLEFETIVYKILSYEKEPYMDETDWYEEVLLVGDPSSSGQSCIITNRNIKEMMNGYHGGYTFNEAYSGGYSSFMTSNINSGVSFFNYRGYIGMSGWGSSEIAGLNNGHKLPIAVIITCGTGSFEGTYDCRSEYIVKVGTPGSPKGAVAAIGTATASTHTCFNNCVDAGTFYGIFVDEMCDMGSALNRGKLNLFLNYPDNPNNSVYKFSYWNNLMGDPGMQIFTREPAELVLEYDPQISFGSNFLEVTVMDNTHNPVEEAWITATKGVDTIFSSGYSDRNGKVFLPINSEESGDVDLVITKQNFIPYLGSFNIGQAEIFVNIIESAVDDDMSGSSSGNNDGIINPGENIELGIKLKNYGSQAAGSISATIDSQNEFITINDDQEDYGTIQPGMSIYSPDDFDFTVDPAALGGTEIILDVQITDEDRNVWNDRLYLIVDGANLNAYDQEIIDDNNGIFEPGETVDLILHLNNGGLIDIDNISGTLSCSDTRISVDDETGYFGNIQSGGNSSNDADHFMVTANTQIIPGTQIMFELDLTNDSGFDQTTIFPIDIGIVSVTDPLGPDEYGYYCYDDDDTQYLNAPVYNWIEIDPDYGGSGNILQMSDGGNTGDIETIPLPISFRFYGNTYSEITICSNGWIAPGQTEQYSFMNWHIPGPLGPSPMIAPFWDDLKTGNGNICYYENYQSHYFVIEWSHLQNEFNNAEETFQVILYDHNYYPTSLGDSEIVFQYETINNVDQGDYFSYHVQHGQYATVGLEDQSETIGLEYTFNNEYPEAAKTLQSGMALKFAGPPVLHNDPHFVLGGFVVDDEDGDGIIDFGENIDLGIILNNIGQDTATGISVVLSTDDEFITLNSVSSDYDDIAGGGNGVNLTGFNFDVSNNCPDGHFAAFIIDVIANEGFWQLTAEIRLNAPEVLIDGILINNDENANGRLDPGETADILISLLNNGGADASNLTTVLSSEDDYITINSDTDNLAYLDSGSSMIVEFDISVSEDTDIGHSAVFDIFVIADNDYSGTDNCVLPIGLNLEDFESGDFGAFPWEFGGNSDWMINGNSYEGTYCAKSGDISDNQTSMLYVELEVTTNGEISFWRKVSSEGSFDYLKFYIDSTLQDEWSGEIDWSEVSFNVNSGNHSFNWVYEKDGSVSNGEDCGWIDYIIFPPTGDNGSPEIAFDPGFFTIDIEIDQTISDTLEISNVGGGIIDYSIDTDEITNWLTYDSEGGILIGGMTHRIELTFDAEDLPIGEYDCNIVITDDLRNETLIPVNMVVTSTNAGNELIPEITHLAGNFPNPFNPMTEIKFGLSNDTRVLLEIYNVKGQKVKTLANRNMKAGFHNVLWNAKDEKDQQISSGIFFYKMQTDSYTDIKKMILMR